MMPVMVAIDVMPGVAMVRFMTIPPMIGVEYQPDMGEMDPPVGVPAIAGAVADDISGGAMGHGRHTGRRKHTRQQSLFDDIRDAHFELLLLSQTAVPQLRLMAIFLVSALRWGAFPNSRSRHPCRSWPSPCRDRCRRPDRWRG